MMSRQQLRNLSFSEFNDLYELVQTEYYFRNKGFENIVKEATSVAKSIIHNMTEYNELDYSDSFEDMIKVIHNSLQVKSIEECDEWHCYEDGTSIKATYSINDNSEISITHTVHMSKHTYTEKYVIQYKDRGISIGHGDYYSGDEYSGENESLDFSVLCRDMGLKEDCTVARVCILSYMVAPFYNDVEQLSELISDALYDY